MYLSIRWGLFFLSLNLSKNIYFVDFGEVLSTEACLLLALLLGSLNSTIYFKNFFPTEESVTFRAKIIEANTKAYFSI